MLEEKVDGKVDEVDAVDARVHHRPDDAARLVREAWANVGSQGELAERCGVHRDTLRRLVSGEIPLSYPMQVTLEHILKE